MASKVNEEIIEEAENTEEVGISGSQEGVVIFPPIAQSKSIDSDFCNADLIDASRTMACTWGIFCLEPQP